MCSHPGRDFRTPEYCHQKDVVCCNKILVIERNCNWQVRSIPANKTNVNEIKKSNTSELLCTSIYDPLQLATIIPKSDSGVSNNYWQTEDMKLLTNVKKYHGLANSLIIKQWEYGCNKNRKHPPRNQSKNPCKKGPHLWWITKCLAYLLSKNVSWWLCHHFR